MKQATKSIFRFIMRSFAVVLPVIVPFILWYAITDPYRVLRHYNTYFPDYQECPARIGMNKGLATFTNLHDRMAEGYKYNAFIFGSSISCYYDADTWASLIKDENDSNYVHPYHLDSASETLQSMARKVKYLEENNIPIQYALIVLDPIIMSKDAEEGPAYQEPPQLHNNIIETIKYHYTFFRAAVNADFFKSWLPSKLEHRLIENGRNLLFEHQPIVYNPVTNQENIPLWDSLITADADKFYTDHRLINSPTKVKHQEPILNSQRIKSLREIADVFKHQHTSYQIIIGPNRAKIALNPSDLNKLRELFGTDYVHDYSVSMVKLLEPDSAMYDNTHYRPYIARILMEKTYR